VARTVCAAVHFLVFLQRGVFCSISDRLLGIRLVHIDPTAHRQPAFEYMNRVMLWNGLSEFLLTVVPLIDLAKVRQSLTRRLLPKAMLQSIGGLRTYLRFVRRIPHDLAHAERLRPRLLLLLRRE